MPAHTVSTQSRHAAKSVAIAGNCSVEIAPCQHGARSVRTYFYLDRYETPTGTEMESREEEPRGFGTKNAMSHSDSLQNHVVSPMKHERDRCHCGRGPKRAGGAGNCLDCHREIQQRYRRRQREELKALRQLAGQVK
jgi:hypothetical protein